MTKQGDPSLQEASLAAWHDRDVRRQFSPTHRVGVGLRHQQRKVMRTCWCVIQESSRNIMDEREAASGLWLDIVQNHTYMHRPDSVMNVQFRSPSRTTAFCS